MIGEGNMIKQDTSNNPLAIIGVALCSILLGSLIGGLTNSINGAISPLYYRLVMGWRFEDIWSASIAQGIFEGTLYGIVFSIVFTTGFSLISKGRASFSFALRVLIQVFLFVLICWIIGGAIATFIAFFSPDLYRASIHIAPEEKNSLLRFAWVGGSIWGGIVGALIGCILSLVWTKNSYV